MIMTKPFLKKKSRNRPRPYVFQTCTGYFVCSLISKCKNVNWDVYEQWPKRCCFAICCIQVIILPNPTDHLTLQWKGLNLYCRGRVLKTASFEGSGSLGYVKYTTHGWGPEVIFQTIKKSTRLGEKKTAGFSRGSWAVGLPTVHRPIGLSKESEG